MLCTVRMCLLDHGKLTIWWCREWGYCEWNVLVVFTVKWSLRLRVHLPDDILLKPRSKHNLGWNYIIMNLFNSTPIPSQHQCIWRLVISGVQSNLWQVRDRATLYLSLLTDGLQNDQEDAQSILLQSLDMPLENLEAGLRSYVSDPIIHNHLISPAIS